MKTYQNGVRVRYQVVTNFNSNSLVRELNNLAKRQGFKLDFSAIDFAPFQNALLNSKEASIQVVLINIPDLFKTFFDKLNSLLNENELNDAVDSYVSLLEDISQIADVRKQIVYVIEPIFFHVNLLPTMQSKKIYREIYNRFRFAFSKFLTKHKQSIYTRASGFSTNIDIVQSPNFYNSRMHIFHKMPFTNKGLVELTLELFGILTSQILAPPKIIILDCDNTLWKGIIGEDKATEIEVDGEKYGYFRMFQDQLKFLREKGILLAICSKNNLHELLTFFREREDLPLRIEDFVHIEASWKPKSEMISQILTRTQLLAHSAVFVDDSPLEIASVSFAHPSINIIEIPKSLERLPDLLSNFDFGNFSITLNEDILRFDSIINEEARRLVKDNNTFSTYLDKLELKLKISQVTLESQLLIPRVTQLINKTNQMNFTTLRLDLSNFLAHIEQTGRVFAASLEDIYGDYGVVGVVLLSENREMAKAEITNFLLSCRALDRGVEVALLKSITRLLEGEKYSSVKLCLIKNERNIPAQDLFHRLSGNLTNRYEFLRDFEKIELVGNKELLYRDSIQVSFE